MTEHKVKPQGGAIADAPGNWVDRLAPMPLRPFLRLARMDRPIGAWLLLWPCWWSLALAAGDWRLGILFALGAVVMRGAGCTFNDIADRDLDGRVARTANRPLPSGAVSLSAAWTFLLLQCGIGLLILLQFNRFAILLGLASLAPVAIYPFMKRITYWPQLFLGIAFNWGALLGWAAVAGGLALPAILLYLGGVFWTLGYDTIYALQDREDDALIGVKSTALKFGAHVRGAVAAFYCAALVLFAAAAWSAEVGAWFWAAFAPAAAHLGWQTWGFEIDNPDRCLAVFRANREFGLLMFLAIIVGKVW